VNQYMAGLTTSLLELGLEGQMLDILVKTFKVTLSNTDITYSSFYNWIGLNLEDLCNSMILLTAAVIRQSVSSQCSQRINFCCFYFVSLIHIYDPYSRFGTAITL
jgi:hypothetical protein